MNPSFHCGTFFFLLVRLSQDPTAVTQMACALPGEDPLSQRPGKLSCFPSNSSSCLSLTRVTLPCRGTAGATLPHCSEVTALLGFEYISGGRGGEGSGDQRLQAQLPPRLQSMLLKP